MARRRRQESHAPQELRGRRRSTESKSGSASPGVWRETVSERDFARHPGIEKLEFRDVFDDRVGPSQPPFVHQHGDAVALNALVIEAIGKTVSASTRAFPPKFFTAAV